MGSPKTSFLRTLILGHPHFEVCLVFQVFRRRFVCFVPALEDRRRQHVKALFLAASPSRTARICPRCRVSSMCRPASVFAVSRAFSPAQISLRQTSGWNEPATGFAMIPTEARPIDDRLPVGIGSCDVVEAAIAVHLDEMTDLRDRLPSLVGRRRRRAPRARPRTAPWRHSAGRFAPREEFPVERRVRPPRRRARTSAPPAPPARGGP